MTITVKSHSKVGYYDSINGKVHSGTRMKVGVNAGWAEYWSTTMPFLNLLHGGSYVWGDGLPSDTVGSVVNSTDTAHAGTYVLEWTGTCEMSVSGLGAATYDDYPTSNRKEYTMAASGNGTATVNRTAGTCTHAAFYNKAYETEYNAGRYISPQFVSDMSNFSVIRFMDWMKASGSRWELWASYPTVAKYNWVHGVPMEAIAELCNLTGADCWINIPHKFSYADKVSMLTALYNALDSGINVYIEWSNEIWNSATPWSEEHWWATCGATAAEKATYTGSNNFNQTAHGNASGSNIISFNSDDVLDKSGYSKGQHAVVLKIDNDNFEIVPIDYPEYGTHDGGNGSTNTVTDSGASWTTNEWVGRTVVNQTDGCWGTITSNTATVLTCSGGFSGGTDNDFDTGDAYWHNFKTVPTEVPTLLYKKNTVGGGANRRDNQPHLASAYSAAQHVDCWTAADGIFGRARVTAVGSTKYNSSTWTGQMLAVAGFRERCDAISVAPYYYMGNYAILDGTPTDQEISDNIVAAWDLLDKMDTYHVPDYGKISWLAYEMGNHFGDLSDARLTRLVQWMDSVECRTLHDWYMKVFADTGFSLACHYMSHHSGKDGVGNLLWGASTQLGKTDEPTFESLADFNTAGGVSKN